MHRTMTRAEASQTPLPGVAAAHSEVVPSAEEPLIVSVQARQAEGGQPSETDDGSETCRIRHEEATLSRIRA